MRAAIQLVADFARTQVGDDVPRDITGPEFVPADDLSEFPWLWFTAIGICIVVVLAVWFCRPRPRRLTARQRAIQRLDRLNKLQLLSKNQVECHFTLLAGILRRCVEKEYGIAASRQTTAEFLSCAARNAELQRHLRFLETFLTACDIAKFAPPAAVGEIGRHLEASLRNWLNNQNDASNSPAALDAPAPLSKMSDS